MLFLNHQPLDGEGGLNGGGIQPSTNGRRVEEEALVLNHQPMVGGENRMVFFFNHKPMVGEGG
jgi:hypothetical protein